MKFLKSVGIAAASVVVSAGVGEVTARVLKKKGMDERKARLCGSISSATIEYACALKMGPVGAVISASMTTVGLGCKIYEYRKKSR